MGFNSEFKGLNYEGNKRIDYSAKYVWEINTIISDVINMMITFA